MRYTPLSLGRRRNSRIRPLSWRWSQNCCAWGLGTWYRIFRVDLVNRILVYCGRVLLYFFVGDGDGCRYVGVGISLGRVIAARRSSMRLFTLILVGCVLPIFWISYVLFFSSLLENLVYFLHNWFHTKRITILIFALLHKNRI